MKPAPVDLPIIWRNCDWEPVVLKWKDTNGVPIDLTDWTPIASTKDFTLNAIVIDPISGVTRISIKKEDTALLKLGVYQWNWIWEHLDPTDPAQIVLRFPPFLSGTVEVKNPIELTPIPPKP